jgi:hypothetical protein
LTRACSQKRLENCPALLLFGLRKVKALQLVSSVTLPLVVTLRFTANADFKPDRFSLPYNQVISLIKKQVRSSIIPPFFSPAAVVFNYFFTSAFPAMKRVSGNYLALNVDII